MSIAALVDRTAPRHVSVGLPPFRLILLAGCFFLAFHDVSISLNKDYDRPAGELLSQAEQGNVRRQLGFLGVGAVGALGLRERSHRKIAFRSAEGALCLFLTAWLALSLLWSVDPIVSLKRILQFGIVTLCGLTMATRVSGAALPAFVCIATSGYLLVGLGAELALGTFSPGDRFAGTLHPNGQGLNCALMVLSASALLAGAPRAWRAWLRVALVLGFGALLLTRSRTALTSLVLALILSRIVSLPRWRALAATATLAWLGALVVFVGGDGIQSFAREGVELGRDETDLSTFQGRTEVWEACLEYARERPLLGYGFGAFWTPDHLQAISSSLGWGVPDAHSTYVEHLLNLGSVGAAVYVLMMVLAARAAFLRGRASGDAGSRFVLSLILFLLPYGVLESAPAQVSLHMFILIWALLYLLSTPVPEARARRAPLPVPHGQGGQMQVTRGAIRDAALDRFRVERPRTAPTKIDRGGME